MGRGGGGMDEGVRWHRCVEGGDGNGWVDALHPSVVVCTCVCMVGGGVLVSVSE